MMNHNATKLKLISELHAQAVEILRVTELVELTGKLELQEKEVSDYSFLMEKRDPMFDRLALFKRLIDESKDDSQAEQCTAKRKETDAILAKVIALDKDHRRVMDNIKSSVQHSIREINSGKKLNNVYAHPLEQERSTGLLDKTK